jgi:hypothetical protein
MMKRTIFLIIPLIFLLSACSQPGIPAIPEQPERVASPMPTLTTPPEPTLELPTQVNPVPGDPRELMLYSHNLWTSLWVDALLMDYAGGASETPVDTTRTQMWIQQPAQALVVSGPAHGAPAYIWVSDGVYYQENGVTLGEMPNYENYSFIPTFNDDSVEPHPFGSMLGTVLKDYIYSTSMAQRTGEYHLVGREAVAGRDVYVVEYFRYADGTVIDRLWVDTETGVILRYINFGKPAGGPPSVEMVVTDIRYDPDIPSDTFALFPTLPASFLESAPE